MCPAVVRAARRSWVTSARRSAPRCPTSLQLVPTISTSPLTSLGIGTTASLQSKSNHPLRLKTTQLLTMGQLLSCFEWFRIKPDDVDIQDDTAYAQGTGSRGTTIRISRRPFNPERDVRSLASVGITKICTGREFDGHDRGGKLTCGPSRAWPWRTSIRGRGADLQSSAFRPPDWAMSCARTVTR